MYSEHIKDKVIDVLKIVREGSHLVCNLAFLN